MSNSVVVLRWLFNLSAIAGYLFNLSAIAGYLFNLSAIAGYLVNLSAIAGYYYAQHCHEYCRIRSHQVTLLRRHFLS